MCAGAKGYGEKLSREGGGGCNSKVVIRHSFTEKAFTISWNLLKLMSIELVMPSNHLILCCPLLLLPSIFHSISQLFTSGGQSIGTSTSVLVLPVYIQDWFPLELTGLTSLQFKGLSRVFSKPQFKSINFLVLSFFYVQLSHPYVTTGKTITLTTWTFVVKVMSLGLHMHVTK